MNVSRSSKLLSAVFTASLLFACSSGGGSSSGGSSTGSSSGSSTGSSSGSTLPDSITIDGEAAKGIIVGGLVSAHPIVNGAVDYATELGSAITGSTGDYSMVIDDYDGGPVAIRVVPATDGSTKMRCDLAAGCEGGIAFGGDVILNDPDFNLDAVVPTVENATVSVNVSVLTDTAAALAVEALADNSGASAADLSQLISDANSSVANRFGLVGDVTELEVIDITNPVEVAAANDDVLEYNLYSAAIVEAVLSNDTSVSIADAIDAFADQYVGDEGVADTEDAASNTVTLSEILTQTGQVLSAIETEAESAGTDVDLGSLITEIAASAANAEIGSTDPVSGSSATGSTTELLAAKAMVNNLRNLGSGVDLTNAESFGDKIDLASEVFDSDSGAVFEAVGMAAEAIVLAWEAYSDDSTLTSHSSEDSEIIVSITSLGMLVTFDVDTTVTIEEEVESASGEVVVMDTLVAVELTAIDAGSTYAEEESTPTVNTDGSETTTWSSDAKVNLDISGTSTSDMVALTVNKGVFTATVATDAVFSEVESNVEEVETDVGGAEVSDVLFDLSISLAEVNGDNPITFTGVIKLSLDSLSYTYDEADSESYSVITGDWTGWASSWDETFTVGEVMVVISGEYSSASGDEFTASLAINADGKNISFTCIGSEEQSYEGDFYLYEEESTCTDGETATEYVDANFALIYSLDVAGVSNDISVGVVGNRTGMDDGTVSIELSYGDKMFVAEFDSNKATDTTDTVTITNESSVVITLVNTMVYTENGESNSLEGTIKVNGSVYGNITDDGGFVKISYTDGTNVSL